MRGRRLPGHFYWAEHTGYAARRTTIVRANLDGSAVNNQFITGIKGHMRRPRRRVIRPDSDGVG
jgi:hypothetical protein